MVRVAGAGSVQRMRTTRTIRIGLLGCGTVGGSFVHLVDAQRDEIERRTGLRLEIAAVAVRDTARPRPGVDPSLLVDAPARIVEDPSIDLVVETMGGVDETRTLVLDALRAGKPVVTANKELLALHGPELYAVAAECGTGRACGRSRR